MISRSGSGRKTKGARGSVCTCRYMYACTCLCACVLDPCLKSNNLNKIWVLIKQSVDTITGVSCQNLPPNENSYFRLKVLTHIFQSQLGKVRPDYCKFCSTVSFVFFFFGNQNIQVTFSFKAIRTVPSHFSVSQSRILYT